jgi:hypothetical protein
MRRRLQISKVDEIVFINVIMVCVTPGKIREACVKSSKCLLKAPCMGHMQKTWNI